MKITDMIDDLIKESKNGWKFIVAKLGLRLAKRTLAGYRKFLLNQKYPLGSLNYMTRWGSNDEYCYGYFWCAANDKFYRLTRELEKDETGYFTYDFTLYELDKLSYHDKISVQTLDYNKNFDMNDKGELTITLDDGKVLNYIPTPIYHLIISVGNCLGKDK